MKTLFLRIIQHINTWCLLPIIGYLIYLNSMYYYVWFFIAFLLITKIGASIGQHRYFTHRSFKTTPFKENFMALCATLSTTGTVLEYVAIHRYHHANSDNGKDLHSPHEIGRWRSFWHWYNVDASKLINGHTVRDVLKKPLIIFMHNWYWTIIISYIILLGIIDWRLILFCYIFPAGFSWWTSGVLSLPLHTSGYRNFDTSDRSVNNHLWNILTVGEGLHNNHHARPGEYNFAFTRGKWEWDISALIVKKFFI